jgi:XTP/dITP diphosphohydrolase
MKQIVFATENQGKVHEVAIFAAHYGYEILTPSQAGLKPVEVEETGTTYEENARLKVEAYLKQDAAKDLIICGDDTGIEINALGGEPGLHTRRWLGYRMSDDEVIGYVLGRMHGIEDRRAVFKSTVAYSIKGGEIQIVTGELAGRITSVPMEAAVQPGVPFRKLFVIDGKPEIPLWKFDEMPIDQRDGIHSHREKAFLEMFEELS